MRDSIKSSANILSFKLTATSDMFLHPKKDFAVRKKKDWSTTRKLIFGSYCKCRQSDQFTTK
ncbi:CLUMA_CG010589, isoform A [Clunio marinus]|uniref:CLUMA_CG010589, isoform A n=1 Tax=Clunio marinus TaxID=568069 RepID=A0A1J1IAB0_9DIPT|nr:CLUMA_CG010589, isoform A [Clunio marinus]